MAKTTDLFESYLSCHVCSEIFRDPVSLSCRHIFCSSCLRQFWEQARNQNCPICKRKSSKDDPDVNFALKGLTDIFAEAQKAGSPETEKREKAEEVCGEHQEETKLFCKDECEAVFPEEQADSDLKEQLKSDLQYLQDKRNKYKGAERTYNEMVKHSTKQVLFVERQIRAEFNKLHQFLKEEEESRLAALMEEDEQKEKTISREMKMIQEQISSLSDSISVVEEDLQKNNASSQTRARAQCSVSDPQLVTGALIDVAKHLGNLSFSVWEKMKEMVHFSPVILDPNTANHRLCLSDDLTSGRNRGTTQQLPDNPERNMTYVSVLGSEGFSSGWHSWDVEVGEHPHWSVGLAKESVDWKEKTNISSDGGIWCLTHLCGKYIDVVGEAVRVKKSLQRIRVQLDYDRGEVTFYDPEDMTHICTHRDTFTEKLFPWFGMVPTGNAKIDGIKIYHRDFSVIFK